MSERRVESATGGGTPTERGSMSDGLVQLRKKPTQWRDATERAGAESQAEFPARATEPPAPSTIDRRGFLGLLAAGAALAAGCTKAPPERIFPYGEEPPPELTPGNPLHYATRATVGAFASGLLVRSDEGRPTKVEGNPDDPIARGTTGLQEQSLILSLYDPRRAASVRFRGGPSAWSELLSALKAPLSAQLASGGVGMRFLVEPDASPLLADLRRRILARFPQARFVSWSPLSRAEVHRGAAIAFGRPLESSVDLTSAKIVVALDEDLFSHHPERLRLMREFGAKRVPEAGLNRLYVVECAPTITGFSADHRLPLRSAEIGPFALALAVEMGALPGRRGGGTGGGSAPRPEDAASPKGDQVRNGTPSEETRRWIAALAKDLLANRGAAVVVAGARQPASVHAIVHAINATLRAKVAFREPLADVDDGPDSLKRLADEIAARKVEMLAITAWNPAFTSFADVSLKDVLGTVPFSLYLGAHEDETLPGVDWFVPRTHPLEEWGDGRAPDGTVVLGQPLLSRLFHGVAECELLATILGEESATDHAMLRALHGDAIAPDGFDGRWQQLLQKGIVDGSATSAIAPPAPRIDAIVAAAAALPSPPSGIEVGFQSDSKLLDGRHSENAWLLELPDPVTKVAWENPAWLSPATAASLGVTDGDEIAIRNRGSTLALPTVVVPGHADGAVTLTLGWGRTAPFQGVSRDVGTNVYPFRHADAPWFDGGATITRTGRRTRLPVTQGHWKMEGRELAIARDLDEWTRAGAALIAAPDVPTLYPAPPSVQRPPSVQWSMSIDLGKCVGCSVCELACQAENNIPTVGAEGVRNSREMHWIRIDRYWEGDDPANPRAVTQPVPCMHCEDAPCEYVCPVNAAVHDSEGLNEQVYNRCVGTRYCSNNCPYKVRRFNFFEYNDDKDRLQTLAMNPDVTVRERGVMEKCTYCIQRIERARIVARRAGRELDGDDVTPACVQACPTRAFQFGNKDDESSAIAKARADKRRYDLLGELGTRPRTVYLARVRNPNPELG